MLVKSTTWGLSCLRTRLEQSGFYPVSHSNSNIYHSFMNRKISASSFFQEEIPTHWYWSCMGFNSIFHYDMKGIAKILAKRDRSLGSAPLPSSGNGFISGYVFMEFNIHYLLCRTGKRSMCFLIDEWTNEAHACVVRSTVRNPPPLFQLAIVRSRPTSYQLRISLLSVRFRYFYNFPVALSLYTDVGGGIT